MAWIEDVVGVAEDYKFRGTLTKDHHLCGRSLILRVIKTSNAVIYVWKCLIYKLYCATLKFSKQSLYDVG